MGRWALIVGSGLGHVGLVVWLGHIEAKVRTEETAIEMFEAKQQEPPKPPPAEVIPDAAPEPRQARVAAAAKPAAEEEAAAPTLDALPDFGLELGGVSAGGGGFAVQQGTGPRSARPAPAQRKELTAAANTPPPTQADPCQEAAAKPKLLHLPQPAYTEAARAAGIEGKVRVSITVDSSGQVTEVKVLQSLGHGLDEAALAAARGARFEAAVRCGKASSSTFTIAMRFSAT